MILLDTVTTKWETVMDAQLKTTLETHGLTNDEIAVGEALGLDWNTIVQLIITKGPEAVALFKAAVAFVKSIITVLNPPVTPPTP